MRILEMDSTKTNKELKSEIEKLNFCEEWSCFLKSILDGIYEGNSVFWDENILENDSEFVSLFLNLFLYSQQISNEKEQNELKLIYYSLCEWVISDMAWAKFELEDLLSYYDAYLLLNSEYDSKNKLKLKCKEILKTTSSDLNNFKLKFIIFHFALILTGTVNKGKYEYKHYNPGYRYFLYNFIQASFEKSRTRKLLQICEKCFGEFIKDTVKYNNQDPIDSPLNQPFKIPEFDDRVSYIQFVEHMSENPKDFERYTQSVFQPGKFGEPEESRYLNPEQLKKERMNVLKNSKKIIEEAKEPLKAQFELISPE